jgi:BTB/POZ domain
MTSEIVIRVPSENIVAESKISVNIKDFKHLELGETIATSKTEFMEIDACWWLTIKFMGNTHKNQKLIDTHALKEEIYEFAFHLQLKSDELWQSKLYKFKAEGTSRGVNLSLGCSSPFVIESKLESTCSDHPASSIKLTPAGAFLFKVKVSILHRGLIFPCVASVASSYKVVNNRLNLLENFNFSDFKFIVKSREFKVHRVILATTSPVFEKMFTNDMEEACSSECIVEDIEPEIFEHLLRFIYGGKLPEDIGDVSMKLYEAAHYYDIEQLKDICEREVGLKLSVDTAVSLYNWAWTYNEHLKNDAWKIIKR